MQFRLRPGDRIRVRGRDATVGRKRRKGRGKVYVLDVPDCLKGILDYVKKGRRE